jgi:ATP synthase protein I
LHSIGAVRPRIWALGLPRSVFEVIRFRAMADDGNNEKKSGGTLGDLVKAESMIQLALVLPAACVIGGVGGAALDKHFHTAWIAVVGILLGAVGGFVQIYRTASGYMKRGG